jgi:protein-S-isoprenylcysteine O-methyltransferase Ste14
LRRRLTYVPGLKKLDWPSLKTPKENPLRSSAKSGTTFVRTGPYRFSRNPIYLSFILLVLGLSLWSNDLWLLLTLVPAVGIIAVVVIPREERFLEDNFREQYSNYKAAVRRWL